MVLNQEIIQYEALRIARKLVKDELRKRKIKISYVEASSITKAAKHLLKKQPSIYEEAMRRVNYLINP